MDMLGTGLRVLHRLMKQAGPYVLIELLLPGGTLLVLMLHISRTGAWSALQATPVFCPHFFQCQVVMEPPVVHNPHSLPPSSMWTTTAERV